LWLKATMLIPVHLFVSFSGLMALNFIEVNCELDCDGFTGVEVETKAFLFDR